MSSLMFTLPIKPVTKKNSSRIVKTKQGRMLLLPSKLYVDFEKEVIEFVTNNYPNLEPIEKPINLKCLIFKPSRRRSDLVNYIEAIQDALVKANVLADDNTSIVFSTDGSRVYYDKDNPRIEIEITIVNDYRESLITTDVF